MVQVPAETGVTVLPLTVQTADVKVVKVTGSPEVEVALTVAVPPPNG